MTDSLCSEALDSVFHCLLLKRFETKIGFSISWNIEWTRNFFRVPIFSTRKTEFLLAFCEFASVNFEPWNHLSLCMSLACQPVHLWVCLSTCQSVWPFVSPSFNLSVCPPVCMSPCMYVPFSPSVNLSVGLSTRMSACISICPLVSPSVSLSVCPLVGQPVHLWICLSTC